MKQSTNAHTVPWKLFITTTLESLLAFYIATFCMALYFIHRGEDGIVIGFLLGLIYLFIIFVCAKRVWEKMSMGTIFLIIPIAPLIALIMVVSLIPILQYFK